MENLFEYYQHSLIFTPTPDQKVNIDEKEVTAIVKKKKAVFARYYTDSQLITPPPHSANIAKIEDKLHWWHCLRERPIDINDLSAKQRYRIRKGLKNNDIWLTSPQEIIDNAEAIRQAWSDSLSDYPKIYKDSDPTLNQVLEMAEIAKQSAREFWLIRDRNTNSLVGFAHCCKIGKALALVSVKIAPQFLNNEANAALVYQICNHYLGDGGFAYVIDGERNIRHRTNYQDYLVRVLGFSKCLCRVHVIYHPMVKPIVKLLYPFRKLIAHFEDLHKVVFNISCVLRQEEIARQCK